MLNHGVNSQYPMLIHHLGVLGYPPSLALLAQKLEKQSTQTLSSFGMKLSQATPGWYLGTVGVVGVVKGPIWYQIVIWAFERMSLAVKISYLQSLLSKLPQATPTWVFQYSEGSRGSQRSNLIPNCNLGFWVDVNSRQDIQFAITPLWATPGYPNLGFWVQWG